MGEIQGGGGGTCSFTPGQKKKNPDDQQQQTHLGGGSCSTTQNKRVKGENLFKAIFLGGTVALLFGFEQLEEIITGRKVISQSFRPPV